MNPLAKILTIQNLKHISGNDTIEIAEVLGWESIVRKNRFKKGEKIVFVFPDTLIPRSLADFPIEDKKEEKIRIRSEKVNGVISQGLILPLSVLPKEAQTLELGSDVHNILNIERYEKPIPPEISGEVLGEFPTYLIERTEETNWENSLELHQELQQNVILISVLIKYDGASATYILDENNSLRICSKTHEIKPSSKCIYTNAAKAFSLKEKLFQLKAAMKSSCIGIQGEICGPQIQTNSAGFKHLMFKPFLLKDIEKNLWIGIHRFYELVRSVGLDPVEKIQEVWSYDILKPFLQDLLEETTYPFSGRPIEGLVLRSSIPYYSISLKKPWTSFKVINPSYEWERRVGLTD